MAGIADAVSSTVTHVNSLSSTVSSLPPALTSGIPDLTGVRREGAVLQQETPTSLRLCARLQLNGPPAPAPTLASPC